VSQINSPHIFRETLRFICQSTSASPVESLSFRQNFLRIFISLYSVPPIVSSLNIFGEVYNFLLLPSVNMTIFKVKWQHYGTSWYFAKIFLLQAHRYCYLQIMKISSGPVIKQHVISSRSITKPLVCNNFWVVFGVKSCYIALCRTAELVFISFISEFIILQTYSGRPMDSDLEGTGPTCAWGGWGIPQRR
jgi:hypothetical protein